MVIATRMYVGAVIAAGVVLLLSLPERMAVAGGDGLLKDPVLAAGLLAATVALSVFKLRLPLGNGVSTMSMAYAVDFAALITEGAGLATLLGALGVLIQCTIRVRRRQPVHRTAFSVAAVVIAVQVAAWAWTTLDGSVTGVTLATTVLPLVACALVYYLVNTSLVVAAIALSSVVSPMRAWNPEFWWSAPAYLLSAFIAMLVALSIVNGVAILLPVVASPLYVCYRAYHRRWRDMAGSMNPRVAAFANV